MSSGRRWILNFQCLTPCCSLCCLLLTTAPHHEIIYPWLVHAKSGDYISHDLSQTRRRRSVIENDEEGDLGILSVKFQGLGEDFHLKVKPNDRLLPSTFHSVSHRYDGTNVTIDMKDEFSCHHHGVAVSHDNSRVAISNCNGLVSDCLVILVYFGNKEISICTFQLTHMLLNYWYRNGLYIYNEPHLSLCQLVYTQNIYLLVQCRKRKYQYTLL